MSEGKLRAAAAALCSTKSHQDEMDVNCSQFSSYSRVLYSTLCVLISIDIFNAKTRIIEPMS